MAFKYFKKEIASNAVHDRDGKTVGFELIPGNLGVLKLDEEKDTNLVADLNAMADKRRGGVIRISPEIYDALKKKPLSASSRTHYGPLGEILGGIRVAQNPELFQKRSQTPSSAPVVGGADKKLAVTPEEIPPTFQAFRAKVRRASQLQKPPESK